MKKLSVLDNMFLLMDRPDQKMHVVAYAIFEKPANAPENYVESLVEDIRQNPWPLPHYNEKLHRSVGTLGRYFWVEAKDMDMNHHVRLVRLQGRNADQALRDYTTNLYAMSLDYTRPMWEMHVIDGLDRRNEFAIAFKVHHCSIDGISAKNVIEEVLRINPADLSNADMTRKKRDQKTRFHGSLQKVSRREKTKAYWKGLGTIRAQIKSGETMMIPPQNAVPITRFNTIVEPTRSFATVNLALYTVAEIARVTQSTINDVISALVGTAMRHYLDSKGESPAKSLYATMPISIHTEEDMDQSNRICFCAYSLATDAASPIDQIESIRQSTTKAKAQIRSVPQNVLYSLMGLRILSLMIRRLRGIRAVNPRTMTNVLISNVPIFKEERYYKGAKLLGIYPLSLVMDGIGINITVSSYVDRLLFGLASDKTKAPDIEKIGGYMQEALEKMRMTILGMPVQQEA
jgi:diacylglycerol O-acyltransferase